MMTINWERDDSGSCAFMDQPKRDRFIATSAAATIVRALMHEVNVVSASFDQYGLIVFSRFAGISVFGEKSALFYGLYGSSDVSAGPNYCMRQCLWDRDFKSMDSILKGLSSKSVFFSSNDLNKDLGKIIESINWPSIDACNISSQPSGTVRFSDKQVNYSLGDDSCDLSCRYWGRSATNPYIENLFDELESLFNSLSEEIRMLPIPNTFRISYSFQNLSGVF